MKPTSLLQWIVMLGLLAGCASPGMKADGTAMSPGDMDRAEDVEPYSASAANTRATNNRQQLWHVVLGKHAARQAAGAAAGEAVASAGPVGLNNLMAGAGAIEIGRQAAGVASGTLSNATIGMGLLSGMVYTDADLRHRELAQLRAPYFQVLVIGEPKAGEPIDGTVQRVSERLEALRFRINAVAGCNNAFWRGHRIEGLERYRAVACTGTNQHTAKGWSYSVTTTHGGDSGLVPLIPPGAVVGHLQYAALPIFGRSPEAGGLEAYPRFASHGGYAAMRLYEAIQTEIPADVWVMYSVARQGKSSLYIAKGQEPPTEYVLP